MKINEMFKGIQGEGATAGTPSYFVRLSGCNLDCDFCDTKYHKDGLPYADELIISKIKKANLENVVFTGGEPMLQIDDIEKIIKDLPNYIFHLETNGTIYSDKVKEFTTISCSPKEQAINNMTSKELKTYKQYNKLNQTIFKFVYESSFNKWWINFANKVGIENDKIYIMPEGATRKKQLKKMPEVMNYCLEKGYMFSPRLHVLAFNNRRRV